MHIKPIQPIQPTIPFKNGFMKEDEESSLVRGQLNSQVIAHVKPSFKGHWPNYTQPVTYCNHPIPPEGVGEKLDFIA